MRKKQIKSISWLGSIFLLGICFQSCTDACNDTEHWSDNEKGITCRAAVGKEAAGSDLQVNLYVFSSEGGSDYLFNSSLPVATDGSTMLKLNPADLSKKDYRFLFIATPKAQAEIEAQPADGSSFDSGTPWQNVAVAMTGDSLSVDNYYGITDLPGTSILQTGVIEGELKRMVGQMVFCFYKADSDRKPLAVDDADVTSVLDRISSIDITYTEVPRQVVFDADNNPVAVNGAERTLIHSVHLTFDEGGQKVTVPQEKATVETADSIKGGAILKGTCLLPSSQKVRVSMTFHYYDTTPICTEDNESIHKEGCFDKRTLSLSIPKETEAMGLKVLPDYFTINNACLPCNRIIDIRHTSGLVVNTEWN